MVLGRLKVADYLKRVKGQVTGSVVTDGKDRQYRQIYSFAADGNNLIVQRADGNGDAVRVPKEIELDESLLVLFGLYSGDGAKGSEDSNDPGRIVPTLSFSQKERHLIRFAVDQFRRVFPGRIRFVFSLGEDSAFFMAGQGRKMLTAYYGARGRARIPAPVPLKVVRSDLDSADKRYLAETRPDAEGTNEEHLSFYYQHKPAMEAICIAEKTKELASVGIKSAHDIVVTASLRRPFKKGARIAGGSSRSDEIHLGGLNGVGELFLKMMHEIEDSILQDSRVSSSGLVEWRDIPSRTGQTLDLQHFFTRNPYGQINNTRPVELTVTGDHIVGRWRQSSRITLARYLRIDPLWCYIAGLYLAEGSTPKETLFRMFADRPGAIALGFTSSEGTSIELMLRSLRRLFSRDDCLDAWKVKVGSQYFPELVVTGLKHGMSMLRGGSNGQGKLRTIEVSLPIKEWALDVADAPLAGKSSTLRQDYADRYSHVEPTGSGVARIDFWASSTLSRWYFPVLMYTVFGGFIADPTLGFYR